MTVIKQVKFFFIQRVICLMSCKNCVYHVSKRDITLKILKLKHIRLNELRMYDSSPQAATECRMLIVS